MEDPYFEDTIRYYLHYSLSQLFPKQTKNKYIVYFLGSLHLLGGIVLQYAPYILSPSNLIYYIAFIIINFIGYYIFNDNCFMTLLSNYYGKLDDSPLRMRWGIFKGLLLFNLFISIIGYLVPQVAPVYWFRYLSGI